MARSIYLTLLVAVTLGTVAQPSLVQIKKNAEGGDAKAQKQLAKSYESTFNFSEAERWYREAAISGDPEVLLALAGYYAGGKPKMNGAAAVPANATNAIALYSLAAIQGHNRAQHDLAIQFNNGTIVPRNKIRAYQLFRLSGILTAKPYLDRLTLEMTTAELEDAERQVEDFRPQSFKNAFPQIIHTHLNLQGIVGRKGKQMALINGQSVDQGKSIEMIVAGFPVTIKCERIEKVSVSVSFEGGGALLQVR